MCSSSRVKVKTTTGIRKNKKTTTTTVWVKAAGPTATLHRDPSTGNEGLLDAHEGKIPEGWQGAAGAGPHGGDQLLAAGLRRLPGRPGRACRRSA